MIKLSQRNKNNWMNGLQQISKQIRMWFRKEWTLGRGFILSPCYRVGNDEEKSEAEGGDRQVTLRVKVILLFSVITIPLVCFLLYTNHYSSQVVRKQVANYNSALLTLYGDQIDQTLENGSSYLYKLANQEPLIRSLVYTLDNKDRYTITLSQVVNKLYSDSTYNTSFYLNFVYNPFNQDLIMVQTSQKSFQESSQSEQYIKRLFSPNEASNLQAFVEGWRHCRIGNEQYLLRIVETDTNTYVGALIRNDDLLLPLQSVSEERHMEAFFLDRKGEWLTTAPPDTADAVSAVIHAKTKSYQTVRGEERYLLVQHTLRLADLEIITLIPENVILQQVPLFQRISYAVPFAAALVLFFLLVNLQKLVLRPIHYLIKGMRQISKGNLDTRLSTNLSHEFSLISATFNSMASQIQDLKISMYEEEIRSHKAELKQLQLQMNPHFLYNSLNIIYNLAEARKYDLIQRMSSHMVNYLRFFARLREHSIHIWEEMDNIEHYIEIQKLRFPKHLEYDFDIEDSLKNVRIPPLTIHPFVENALKHGFTTGKSVFQVKVRIHRITDGITDFCEITIENNGKKFPAQLVESLSGLMETSSFTREHTGIWSVYNQLKIFYRGQAGMSFSNLDSHGVAVTVRIPMQSDGGEFPDV